jgi:hypothetical protein
MVVLVQDAAESLVTTYVKAGYLLLIGDWLGQRA